MQNAQIVISHIIIPVDSTISKGFRITMIYRVVSYKGVTAALIIVPLVKIT